MKAFLASLIAAWAVMAAVVHGFQGRVSSLSSTAERTAHTLPMAKDDKNDTNSKPRNFLQDLQGMFQNFDDVVDDFVYKRMGAGEQWYGKRKYNPSGKVDGDYNGMGRSDYFRIEIARAQKEEMELRRQRRLEEEEAKRQKK